MDPRAWRRFRKNKGALFGAVLVTLVTTIAVVGPLVAPHDPHEQFRDRLLRDDGSPMGPGEQEGFPLGADPLGRADRFRFAGGNEHFGVDCQP